MILGNIMGDDNAQPEETPKADKSGKPGKVSREFVWVLGFIFLIAAGAFGFRGWQNLQKAPDLSFAMDFIKTNLEAPIPPHLARQAINGQVEAFYRENGPVKSVVSHDLDSRQENPFGDPIYLTKTIVQTKNGPVLVHLKVRKHQGQLSIVSFVYEPQS